MKARGGEEARDRDAGGSVFQRGRGQRVLVVVGPWGSFQGPRRGFPLAEHEELRGRRGRSPSAPNEATTDNEWRWWAWSVEFDPPIAMGTSL